MPDNLRVLVENCTSANGKAAPKISAMDGSKGTFYKFSLGFIVKGGEEKARKYAGRYLFADLYIHKRAEDSEKLPLSGGLYNLMLDMLAPAGSKDEIQTRWALALTKLKAAAEAAGITEPPRTDAFPEGDKQLMLATAFVSLLQNESYPVVGKTYTPKQREGSTFVPKQTVGSIEAATAENRTKRGVVAFEVETNTGF
jgi:hypothetical protein